MLRGMLHYIPTIGVSKSKPCGWPGGDSTLILLGLLCIFIRFILEGVRLYACDEPG